MQIGLVKDKFADQDFQSEWVKKPNDFFTLIKEVKLSGSDPKQFVVGAPVDFVSLLKAGENVDVFGKTKGVVFKVL